MGLKTQLGNFVSELKHLQSLEANYRQENQDLQRRADAESHTNIQLVGKVKESEGKIRAREDKLMQLRRDVENAKNTN